MKTKPKTQKEQFAPVPSRAQTDKRLTGAHHRLLQTIAYHDRFGYNGQGCSASHRRIAAITDMHFSTVTKGIAELVVLGYVRSEKSGRDGRERIYHVIYNDDDAAVFQTSHNHKIMASSQNYVANSKKIDGQGGLLSIENSKQSDGPIYSPKGNIKNGAGIEL